MPPVLDSAEAKVGILLGSGKRGRVWCGLDSDIDDPAKKTEAEMVKRYSYMHQEEPGLGTREPFLADQFRYTFGIVTATGLGESADEFIDGHGSPTVVTVPAGDNKVLGLILPSQSPGKNVVVGDSGW